MEKDDYMPRVDEPMEEYLKSDRYRKRRAELIFSDFQGQEESNYHFWRILTPKQRLELHSIMVRQIYGTEITEAHNTAFLEVQFSVHHP